MFKYCLFVFLILPLFSVAQIPKPSAGSVRHYPQFKSNFVAARDVDVWLPHDYSSTKKYAVLYMNDGRDMFDTSHTDWQEWRLDETLTLLKNESKIRDVIVVAIYSNGKLRQSEYFPQGPFELLPKKQQDSIYTVNAPFSKSLFFPAKIQSAAYLKFIVEELKPFIDKSFSVYKNAQNTFIGGASMGALLSMYAICEYPKVFGGAACLSPHWPGIMPNKSTFFPDVMLAYLDKKAPSGKTHFIYFDHGDKTYDYYYGQTQIRVDSLFSAKGYSSKNYLSLRFANADHSTKSWAARVDKPLLFLLKSKDEAEK